MKEHLSQEQFSSVWSRVAPEGSESLTLRQEREEAAKPEQYPYEETRPIVSAVTLAQMMERESLLKAGLRCIQSCGRLWEAYQAAGERCQRLREEVEELTQACYRPTCCGLCASWFEDLYPDLFFLSRSMEEAYRAAAQERRWYRLRGFFLEAAQEHEELQHLLRARVME